MRTFELLEAGAIIQWKRQDLTAFEVGVMLDNIENGRLIGPFEVIKSEQHPPKSQPSENERLLTIRDLATKAEGQLASNWFERFSG